MQNMDGDPISWATAERVARRINGREPFSSSYLLASFEDDLLRLTEEAESLVEVETGLNSSAGHARVKVANRDEWVGANLVAMRRLLRPLTERLGSHANGLRVASVGRTVTGGQLGLILGWASTRVLGQYDFLLPEDEHPEKHDIIYYVAPNVIALEKRFAFPPEQFRLWLALHECTHRAQFTGVPWLTQYFQQEVANLMAAVDADPQRLARALKSAAEHIRRSQSDKGDPSTEENLVPGGGLLAAFASPEQRESLTRIQGLMALLEGHGEVTMARAGADRIPEAERFHRVLHERRNKGGLGRVLQKLLGMDAKMRQYEEGARFIREVESQVGSELFRRVWDGPENLPTYDEIRDPTSWIGRLQTERPGVAPSG